MPIGFDFNFWQNLHYNNIFVLALELLLCGGWLFILWQFWAPFKEFWINWRQEIFAGENPNVLMEINIPTNNERNIEAIEQLFAQIHGLRRTFTWWEKWWKGQFVLKVSLEIVSFESYIRFYIRSPYKLQHLIEHALYSQYPEAELKIIKDEDDFIHLFPNQMPDSEFDMLGTEYILSKPQYYPIKTYKEYEQSTTGEHLDPMRHMLELMSNLKEGEYLWYQLVIVPEYEEWAQGKRSKLDVLLGRGDLEGAGKSDSILKLFFGHIFSMIKYIILAPISILREIYRQLFAGTGKIILSQVKDHTYQEFGRQLKGTGKEFKDQIVCLHEAFLSQFRKKKPSALKPDEERIVLENQINMNPPNININMPPTVLPSEYIFKTLKQKRVIDAVERKLSQHIYKTCIRTIYLAKKPVFAKFRFWSELHGVFKHFSDIDYNILVRGMWSKTTADYFFAKIRKRRRQKALIFNAKGRDWYAGDEWNYLSTEELATLWHLPLNKDLLANCSTVQGPVKPPPPAERVRAGFQKEKLLDGIDAKSVPNNLPVTEYEPYNYS